MKHAAIAISLAALLGCSERKTATPTAKPVETLPAKAATTAPAPAIPSSAGDPLAAHHLYPGAARELVFPGRPVRIAWRRTPNKFLWTTMVASSERGVTDVGEHIDGVSYDRFGLFVTGDRVVAVATLRYMESERSIVTAWRLALSPNDEVIVEATFEGDGPAAPLPSWIAEPVRTHEQAAKLPVEMATPRRTVEEQPTDEELEEAAMTDAVEEFGATERSAVVHEP